MKRQLGVLDLTLIVMGSVIGAGVFIVPGFAAKQFAGPAVLISVVLCGVLMIFMGFIYTELALLMKSSRGGGYSYIYVSLGKYMGWISGNLLCISYVFSVAAAANSWSSYLVDILNMVNLPVAEEFVNTTGEFIREGVYGIFDIPSFCIVFMMSLVLTRGISDSARINRFFMLAKFVSFVIIIFLGIKYVETDNLSPFMPRNRGEFGRMGVSGVLYACNMVLFITTGFEVMANVAPYAKKPSRSIPFSLIGGISLSIALYLIVIFVMFGVVHYSELAVSKPISVVLNMINISGIKVVVQICIAIGMLSIILFQLFAASNVLEAMSRDGLFTRSIIKSHKRYGTPHRIYISVGIVIGLISATIPAEDAVVLSNVCILSVFIMAAFALIVLRKKQKHSSGFQYSFIPIVPYILSFIFILIILSVRKEVFYLYIGLMLILSFWYLYKKKKGMFE